MKSIKKIHAWEIDGYVKLDKKFTDEIIKNLYDKYGSLNKARLSLNLSSHYTNKNNLYKSYKKSNILFKLIDIAKLPRSTAEKHIISWKDSKRDLPKGGYKIKFPITISPIHIRIISHLIGDGNISRPSTWMQNNVEPLEKLQKKLFNTGFKRRKTRSNTITIPRVLIKLFSRLFNVPLNKFNKIELIKHCLDLPKEHRIQVLTAIIEDEGTISNYAINIRMKDKNLMKSVSLLIDSLCYKRSSLKTSKHLSGYSNKKGLISIISINVAGTKKYVNDLKEMEKKFGGEVGLWKKKEKVKNITKNKSKIYGLERNRNLEKQILKRGADKIYFRKVKKDFKLTDNETISVLRRMDKKNAIEKVSRGLYTINNLGG